MHAHKVILAACSPFFKRVLSANPHQNPLIYLKGVDHDNLMAVLNFMYHGEVNVAQEELSGFLRVAEELAVKGLTDGGKNKTAPSEKKKRPPPLTPAAASGGGSSSRGTPSTPSVPPLQAAPGSATVKRRKMDSSSPTTFLSSDVTVKPDPIAIDQPSSSNSGDQQQHQDLAVVDPSEADFVEDGSEFGFGSYEYGGDGAVELGQEGGDAEGGKGKG